MVINVHLLNAGPNLRVGYLCERSRNTRNIQFVKRFTILVQLIDIHGYINHSNFTCHIIRILVDVEEYCVVTCTRANS